MNNVRYKLIDQFNGTYWSGLSGSMFIGPYFVDEINQFSYTLSENTIPVYSYNSFTPIFLPGARLIQGEFGINYKQDNYIFTLLEKIRSVNNGVENSTMPHSFYSGYEIQDPSKGPSKRVPEIMEEKLNPELLLIDSDEGRADVLKSYIKTKQQDRQIKTNYMSGLGAEVDKFMYEPNRYKPALFALTNITLRFGYNVGEGIVLKVNETGRWSESIHTSDNNLFNIGTGCVLINAVLTSRSIRVTDSGVPTVEVYSFMAQDIRPLNKALESTSTSQKTASAVASAKKIEIN